MSPAAARSSWVRYVRTLLSVAVVVAIFFVFLPRIVDYGEVWAVMSAMTWLEFTTLGLFAVWNQLTYSFVESAARPGLDLWRATQITLTSTAISNTLPAGAALGVGVQTAMYTSFGFRQSDIAISLMVTGIWNTFIKLAMPVVALALLVLAGGGSGGLISTSIVGLALLLVAIVFFTVALRSERGAQKVGQVLTVAANAILKVVRRPALPDRGEAVAGFRRRAIDLLRARWFPVTIAVIVSHTTLYLVLLLALRHLGISNPELSWQEVLAAFSFVRLISVVPITPGSVGVVELGLTAALVAGGGNEGQVVAAVLVYRAFTFVLPVPLGGAAYLLWRKGAAGRTHADAAAT